MRYVDIYCTIICQVVSQSRWGEVEDFISDNVWNKI